MLLQLIPPHHPPARRMALDLAEGYRAAGLEVATVTSPPARAGTTGALVGLGDWLVAEARRRSVAAVELWDPMAPALGVRRLVSGGCPVTLVVHRVPPGFEPLPVRLHRRRLWASSTETVLAGPRPGGELPVGVELDWFRPVPGPPRRGRLTLLARPGSCPPQLAVDTLAALRARGVDARLELVAPDPPPKIDRLPVTVVTRADPPRVAAADVALELDPGDALGRSALEALACGTPVVAAGGSAAARLIGPGMGVAVPPGPRGVAAAVVEVAAWGERARRGAARRQAERFPLTDAVEAMLPRYPVRRSAGGSAGSGTPRPSRPSRLPRS